MQIFINANIGNKKKLLETKVYHTLWADFHYSWVRYCGVTLYVVMYK